MKYKSVLRREKERNRKNVLWHILGHSIYQENPPGSRASNKQTNKHNLFRHRTSQQVLINASKKLISLPFSLSNIN